MRCAFIPLRGLVGAAWRLLKPYLTSLLPDACSNRASARSAKEISAVDHMLDPGSSTQVLQSQMPYNDLAVMGQRIIHIKHMLRMHGYSDEWDSPSRWR